MSAMQFPAFGYYKTANTAEIVPVFSFVPGSNQQLNQLIVTLYKHGDGGGNERIRANLYADSEMTKLIASGSWFQLSAIENIATYWRGRIGLTIPGKPWLAAAATYHLGIESDNYTRDGDDFYLSFWADEYNEMALRASLIGERGMSIE